MVGSGQLGVRGARLLGLLGHRLDSSRAIDGLLGAGDVGQPKASRLSVSNAVVRFFGQTLGGADKGEEWRGLYVVDEMVGFLLLLCPVEHLGGNEYQTAIGFGR